MRNVSTPLHQGLKAMTVKVAAGLRLVFLSIVATAATAGPTAGDLAIENVTIVSPERPGMTQIADIHVHDGRISSISRAAAPRRQRRAHDSVLVIDGTDLYVVPGLIDSHVHTALVPGMTPEHETKHPGIAQAARDQIPRSYLLYGYTTLIDLISTPAAMSRWKAHALVPDTFFCGGAALMDGYPMNYDVPTGTAQPPTSDRYARWPYMLIEEGTRAPPGVDARLHTPENVVSRMKADGAICVKTFYERGFGAAHDLPVPRLETLRRLVRAAHAAGLPVFLHANSAEAQAVGVAVGIDIFAHGLWNWNDVSHGTELPQNIQQILDGVLAQKSAWQPTIQVLYGLQNTLSTTFLSDPLVAKVLPSSLIEWYRSPEGQWFHDSLADEIAANGDRDPARLESMAVRDFSVPIDRVTRATSYLAAHGGRLLFGTDTPSSPTYANPPGLNGWFEMQRLVAAGETPTQIFQSATVLNARALKQDDDIGTVEVGKRANLLLLRQDPTKTIQAYATLVKVILGGRVLDPTDLAARSPPFGGQ
jgi:imidazolonepropionase-like amidohydrolase